MLYWFLNFTPQTRPACQVVLQTPSKSLGSHEVTFSPTVSSRKPFSCNTYASSSKCCKQKTCSRANFFRCNTYRKQGEGGALPVRSAERPFVTSLLPYLLTSSFLFTRSHSS